MLSLPNLGQGLRGYSNVFVDFFYIRLHGDENFRNSFNIIHRVYNQMQGIYYSRRALEK